MTGSKQRIDGDAGERVQVEARALGDPTRHALFRHLLGAVAPLGVAELTTRLGVHHNATRQHLAKLIEAGMVTSATLPHHGRGRPRLGYSVVPAAALRWGGAGPYERLAVLLSEAIRTGDAPRAVGRRAGRKDAPGPGNDPVEALGAAMGRYGFEPRLTRRGSKTTIELTECPFRSAALADPDTVCDIHLGLAEGVAEAVGGLSVERLVRKDPRRAGCRLHCQLIS